MSLTTEHRLDGKHARREGLPLDAAPSPVGTREGNEWRRGWWEENGAILRLRSGHDE